MNIHVILSKIETLLKHGFSVIRSEKHEGVDFENSLNDIANI